MGRQTGSGNGSGTADAKTNPEEVLGTQLFDDIGNTVVAGSPGRIGSLVGTRGNIKVIVDDDYVLRL